MKMKIKVICHEIAEENDVEFWEKVSAFVYKNSIKSNSSSFAIHCEFCDFSPMLMTHVAVMR